MSNSGSVKKFTKQAYFLKIAAFGCFMLRRKMYTCMHQVLPSRNYSGMSVLRLARTYWKWAVRLVTRFKLPRASVTGSPVPGRSWVCTFPVSVDISDTARDTAGRPRAPFGPTAV